MNRHSAHAVTGMLLACLSAIPGSPRAQNGNGNGNGNGHITVAGQARVAFDDYQVQLPEGTTHRSLLTQTYSSNIGGPLLLPGLGRLTGAVNYDSGDNVNKLSRGAPASEKRIGTSLTANVLPGVLGGFASLTPTVGRTQYNAVTGEPGGQEYIEDLLGGSAGLSLPAFPSISLDFQKIARRDNDDIYSPDTDSLNTHGRMTYARGPVRAEVDRATRRTTMSGLPGAGANQETLYTNAMLDLPEVNRFGVQAVSAQGSFSGSTSRVGSASAASRIVSLGTRLTSRSVRAAGITNFASWGPNYRGDLVSGRHSLGQAASIFSSVVRPLWNASNQVQYSMLPGDGGAAHEASERLSGEVNTPSRKVGWRGQVEEVQRWGRAGPTSAADVFSQRVSWYPVRRVDTFLDGGYSSTRQPGAGTLSRGFSAGGGGTWRALSWLEVGPTYERSWMRNLGADYSTVRDAVAVSVRSSPLDRLNVGVTGRIEQSESSGSMQASDRYTNISADAGYEPVRNLTVTGRVIRYDRQAGYPGTMRTGSFETWASVGYRLGRTSASLTWESRAFTMPNAYRHVTASLTRSF